MTAVLSPPNTHHDRPTPKQMLPFRINVFTIGGRRAEEVEYDVDVPMPGGKSCRVANKIGVDTPLAGCFNEPLGYHIKTLMQQFWAMEARVDGLLASVDTLTTDVVLKDREIEKLTNQLAEMTRQRDEAKKTSKGK